jgi:hypothetical protein
MVEIWLKSLNVSNKFSKKLSVEINNKMIDKINSENVLEFLKLLKN